MTSAPTAVLLLSDPVGSFEVVRVDVVRFGGVDWDGLRRVRQWPRLCADEQEARIQLAPRKGGLIGGTVSGGGIGALPHGIRSGPGDQPAALGFRIVAHETGIAKDHRLALFRGKRRPNGQVRMVRVAGSREVHPSLADLPGQGKTRGLPAAEVVAETGVV